MFGNRFSIFEAIDVWELWNQLPQICLLYHGRHGVFTIHQWVHVLNFFWSQILKVDRDTTAIGGRRTPTNDGFWNYCRKIREFPSSELLCFFIARTFSKQHQTPAFSSNLSHSLIEFVSFLFSITLALIVGSLQQKLHGDHRQGSKNRWLCWDHQRDQWSKSTTIATSAAPWTTSTGQWPFYGRCAEGNWLGWFLWPLNPLTGWRVCEVFHHPDKRSYGETSFQRNAEKVDGKMRCWNLTKRTFTWTFGGPLNISIFLWLSDDFDTTSGS